MRAQYKMSTNNGHITFERYRQIMAKQRRQYLEIERLRGIVENIAELAQVYPAEGKQSPTDTQENTHKYPEQTTAEGENET